MTQDIRDDQGGGDYHSRTKAQIDSGASKENTVLDSALVQDADAELVERVARAIVTARGGDPDKCVSGYSWAAGEAGQAKAGSVCRRRNWEDAIPAARAAIQATRLSVTTPDTTVLVERRRCTICHAIVASYPEGMCCHCRELPWPLASTANPTGETR